jgi:hypothetical protein
MSEKKPSVSDFDEEEVAKTADLNSSEIGGFKDVVSTAEKVSKPFIGPPKPEKQDIIQQEIADLLEICKEKKKQINDYSSKVKTKELRMPTELTNARNISVKISE